MRTVFLKPLVCIWYDLKFLFCVVRVPIKVESESNFIFPTLPHVFSNPISALLHPRHLVIKAILGLFSPLLDSEIEISRPASSPHSMSLNTEAAPLC